jgi:hypothetical protein
MFAARRFTAALPRALGSQTALFHASRPALVKVGDAVPNVELVENSPGNKVNLAKELSGKGIIVGVPAAFSMLLLFFSFFLRLELYLSSYHSLTAFLQAPLARAPTFPVISATPSSRMPAMCLLSRSMTRLS